ncbi:hypothetical protein KKG51_00785 [Patescibacteria group bacterium]|nr:hypothetical protein [Patescibacteria group bacterium]
MPEYQGEERRLVDPKRNKLSLEAHAARALNRFGGPDAENLDTAEFTEGDEMRDKIRELISPAVEPDKAERSAAPQILTRTTSLDAQARKYVENLVGHAEYGYYLAHNEITDGDLYDPEEEEVIKAPTIEEVAAILQNGLTPEEVEAIKRHIKVPGLVMEPQNLPWRKFIANLDTGTKNKKDTFVSDGRNQEFDRQDQALEIQETSRVTDWKVGIAERKKEPDNKQGLLRDIVTNWEQSEEARLLQLVTPKLYAILQKGALLSGDKKPLDKDGWSILQRADKPQEGRSRIIDLDGLVSGGNYGWNFWPEFRIGFSGYNPESHCAHTQLRYAVMKNA